ncbi:hypothetical protein [Stenotrophomonas sp. NLF4-10]|uniref:hypothetical protein n=1 Tax=Stenotrophomonas sp. NLF4-10 TaxID=2918754 RepID=UPI001EFB347D|nr:hypothetical protein [Stenotrophomonas sp. NLF4-10]MCG8277891.1 hypothetical protein [Stenotrophomonas sp. NLF4-10]
MRYPLKTIAAFALACALGGCGPAPSDLPPVQEAASAPAEPEVIEATTSDLISSTPSSLPNCDRAITTVSWDARGNDDVTQVNVMVRSPGKIKEVLFSKSGATGQARTDEWVRPGTMFVLRNADGNVDLASIIIGGPRCDPDPQ